MSNHFWKKWVPEVLSQLQQRTKWLSPFHTLKIGDLVLFKDTMSPPTKWSLVRIVQLHPGADGLARAATIQTTAGQYECPVARLILLPVDSPAVHLHQPTAFLNSHVFYKCIVNSPSTVKSSCIIDFSGEQTCIDNIFIKLDNINYKTFTLQIPLDDHFPIFMSINKMRATKDAHAMNRINYNKLKTEAELINWSELSLINEPNLALNNLVNKIKITPRFPVDIGYSQRIRAGFSYYSERACELRH